MEIFYTFFICFLIVFVSELGDKTQLLVLSFSNKMKSSLILLGVAFGTFFSHGLAILFGSKISSLSGDFHFYLSIFTYVSFILFGILGFLPKKNETVSSKKSSLFTSSRFLSLNYIFVIAMSIFVGEIGDKTFLASLGLGLQYPTFKIPLILGSIIGMVLSNGIAIFFGKLLGSKLNQNFVQLLSNLIFILFGVLGFLNFILH